MTTAQLSDEQKTLLHAINGSSADHYSLARYCEAKGLHTEGDTDDMELSYLCLRAPGRGEDFWPLVVGEIRGDADAVIKITVALD